MKKMLLSVVAMVAMSISFAANAALEPINESSIYFAQTVANQNLNTAKPDLAVVNTKVLDNFSHNMNEARFIAMQNTTSNATADTLTKHLPSMGSNGAIQINIGSDVVSYKTIDMNMGDLTKLNIPRSELITNYR